MNVSNVYSVCLGSFLLFMIGWNLAAIATYRRRSVVAWLKRQASQREYHLPLRALDLRVRLLPMAQLLTVLASNVIACVVRVGNISQLQARTGQIALMNLVPLSLGRKTGFLVNHALGLSLGQQTLAHSVFGLVFLLESLFHAISYIWTRKSWPNDLLKNTLLGLLGLITLSSIAYIRRLWYEVCSKLHLAAFVALNVLLWLHIPLGFDFRTVCLALSTLLWALDSSLWLLQMIYTNNGIRKIQACEIHLDGDTLLLSLTRKRPWAVKPGQYVYLTMPALPNAWVGRFQAHPYMVAWENTRNHLPRGSDRSDVSEISPAEHSEEHTIHFLVEQKGDFNESLARRKHVEAVLMDGPHGSQMPLEQYDRVLLIAKDIGVGAHLLAIRDLLKSHQDMTGRVRRVSLLWYMGRTGQTPWVLDILRTLMHHDEYCEQGQNVGRKILSIYLCAPSEPVGLNEAKQSTQHTLDIDLNDFEADMSYPRILKTARDVNLANLMSAEWKAEAGSMVVSVCGDACLVSDTRSALQAMKQDVDLLVAPYQLPIRN